MAKKALLIILCWMGGSIGFCGWAEGQEPLQSILSVPVFSIGFYHNFST
jgi:hypothetical protein